MTFILNYRSYHRQVVDGKFKIPFLRGDIDSYVTRYERFEQLYKADLDNWLCNMYLEIDHLSRYHKGQREYTIRLLYNPSFKEMLGDGAFSFISPVIVLTDGIGPVEDEQESKKKPKERARRHSRAIAPAAVALAAVSAGRRGSQTMLPTVALADNKAESSSGGSDTVLPRKSIAKGPVPILQLSALKPTGAGAAAPFSSRRVQFMSAPAPRVDGAGDEEGVDKLVCFCGANLVCA